MTTKTIEPDVKHWPEGDHVSVDCPSCGKSLKTYIGQARELGLGGRLENCDPYGADVIIEAHTDGVRAFLGREVNSL